MFTNTYYNQFDKIIGNKINYIYIILLILIILFNLAIIRLSKNAGEKYRYLVWIPPFNIYYLVKLSFGNPFSLITFILTVISSNITITILGNTYTTNNLLPSNINNIIYFICIIISFISIIKIYKNYSKNWILYTILSIISLGILSSIFLFIIRNNKRKQVDFETELNTNANVYINIDKLPKNNKDNETINPKVESEEYDIRNSWDGPK